MKKIKLITDSASDITPELAKQYDIHLIPMHIAFGDEEYLDQVELGAAEFYEKLESFPGVAKTAQITVAEHMEVFRQFMNEYAIIYVPISSKGSGTYQSANLAKSTLMEEDETIDITIVDSMNFTYGYGMWVLEAAKMLQSGAAKEELVAFLEDRFARTEVLFAVDTLDYLQKGGRISPAAKIVADILDIRPILIIENGLVMNCDKVRGRKKLYPKMVEKIMERADHISDQLVGMVTANTPEKADEIGALLKERAGVTKFATAPIGACVGVHTGPGAIGIVYLKK